MSHFLPPLMTPWTAAHQASLSFTIFRSLLKLVSNESMMPFSHLILCYPLIFLPSTFPSIREFSNETVLPSHQVAKILELRLQHSLEPMNIQGWFPLGLSGVICLLSKGLSGVFSSTTIWKHQFFGTQPSFWPNSHIHTWLLEKP